MFSTVTETTLQELSEMGTAPIPMPEAERLEDSRVILGNRQMAAVAFVILALLALVSAMAYLAGRVMTTATQAPSTANAPEQVIVVDSKIPRPAALAAPPAATIAPPVIAKAAELGAAPINGESYFQVGSVDRGMADVSVEYIKKNGLDARVAAGAASNVFRVLVGPVGAANATEVEARLKALGFTPFLKKY